MFRTLVIVGSAIDLIIVLFLLLVTDWVIDSWHDQRVAGTGLIVTGAWLIAFVMAAGSPLLAYGLRRRKGSDGHVLVTLWLPAFLLITIGVVGLIVSPP